MKLSKETQGFIYLLLLKELEAEYIQDSEKPIEIDYVYSLVNAAKEFGKEMGFPYDYVLNDAIKKLLKGE